MKQNLNLEDWLRKKITFTQFWYLDKSQTVEFEFKKIHGPRSSYAFVRFDCNPSTHLSFNSNNVFDSKLSPDWIKLFEASICEAIVDSLICNSLTPYFGCELNLIQIKYDEVGSSEDSFYKATKEAMKELIITSDWKHYV